MQLRTEIISKIIWEKTELFAWNENEINLSRTE